MLGAPRRQRRRAPRTRCRGRTGATLLEHLETIEIAGDRNLRRPALPGAVGDPPDGRRAPRLPRLRGPGRGRRLARRRRGRRAAVGAPHARRRGRDAPTARSTSPCTAQSVDVRLEDDLDVARGDMLADPDRPAGRRARSSTAERLLDERAAARAAREARRQAHDALGARDRGRARLGGRHGDARGHARRPSGSS